MKSLGSFLTLVSSLILVGTISFVIVSRIQFEQHCGGYLKRAADANTIELAERELGKALDYLESESLTRGSTHTFYFTPDCELDFWYENLAAARTELQAFPATADSLTRSNQLMKLRESILESDEDGPEVIVPPGLAFYPWHHAVRWSIAICFPVIGLGFILLAGGSKCSNRSNDRCRGEALVALM